MNDFELYFYKSSSNKEIVMEFIDSFKGRELTKIHENLDSLQRFGLNLLRTPLVKKIINHPAIYELRIKSEREVRFLFCLGKPYKFVILHGFVKKTEKTPLKELKIVIKRAKEFS